MIFLENLIRGSTVCTEHAHHMTAATLPWMSSALSSTRARPCVVLEAKCNAHLSNLMFACQHNQFFSNPPFSQSHCGRIVFHLFCLNCTTLSLLLARKWILISKLLLDMVCLLFILVPAAVTLKTLSILFCASTRIVWLQHTCLHSTYVFAID